MKSKKISILASSTVLLLTVGLVSGCGDAEEEDQNAAAIIAPAPIVSEDVAIDSIVGTEEISSMDDLEGIEPIESISDMLDDAMDTADDAVDATVDSMLGMVDSGMDATQDLIEDTQETLLDAVDAPQLMDLVDDAADVVPSTSDIVRGVQQGLTDAGFNPGPADGMSGPRTVAAINDFQKQNNLTSGGQLTKETLRALGVNF